MESENMASCTLRHSGYQILARNYRLFGVEIDILAQKNGRYYLFEVKQTIRKHFIQGWFPYTYTQWKRQMKAIENWSIAKKRQINVSTGIIIFDENFKILVLNPEFFYR